jgi:phosphoenolpyruvate carboxykinase (ATP)
MNHNLVANLNLHYLGFGKEQSCYYQLDPDSLIQYAIENKEGEFTDTGAFAVDTGEFKGRSPKDKFIVKDAITESKVWWSETNIPFTNEAFELLYDKVIKYLSGRTLFVRDAFACAEEKSELSLRVITETAYQNLFAYNLFIRPENEVMITPEWTVIAAPGFRADPEEDQTRQHNFSIINFSKKMIIIGGTGYTGEIKKSIFSVLNFLLPQNGILPMHCSANIGSDGETALFFGLSGTGKTTLSADKDRQLIGDDEHGWSGAGVFNFEGGCYAKTVNLNPEKEPQIYAALKYGALLENICYYPDSDTVDFENISKTENTRVSYPLHFIENAVIPSVGGIPKNIFFLTADAFGVLPPIAKLDREQALYYFVSGYTAKVAGTEQGINEPQATFSACFGKAFLPLHPLTYADMLGKRLKENEVNVWLVNTGWTGGSYGTGERIQLKYTRSLIKAALDGSLNEVEYECLPVFDLMIPKTCNGVPAEILNPANTWPNPSTYWLKAIALAELFKENYKQYTK